MQDDPNEDVALELRGLSKTYGRGAKAKRAVSDVSLSVRCGEVYGFLGPNGAGKSTTIRMALGLIRPTAGDVRLFGKRVTDRDALSRVGSLVDGGTFYPFLSGYDNLRVLARTRGIDEGRIGKVLDRADLTRDAKRKFKGYSTGMKQRLGVAAALLDDPDLVILDEPANGLDAAGIQDMRHLIRALADEGKAVFLCSHLLHEVQQVCDRLAIVSKGKLIREASTADLLGTGIRLSIEAHPLDAAMKVLEARRPIETPSGRLTIEGNRGDAPGIVRDLVAADVEVFRVAAEEQNLEKVFLEMTSDPDA